MKIQAVLPEVAVAAVVERLMLVGVDDVVVSAVRESVGLKATRSFRGVRYAEELGERCSVECWPDDEHAEAVGRAIQQAVEKSATSATVYVSITE